MTTEYPELLHPRKISGITEGEIALYGSSDGGTTWYSVKVAASGGVLTGGTSQTIQTAKIDISAATDNEIIAATASQKIKVVSITFTMSTENDVTFKNGSTAISGAMPFAGTNEPRGMTQNFWPFPLTMNTNTAFNITLSAAQQVSGLVQYYKE